MRFALLIFVLIYTTAANAQNLSKQFAVGERPRLDVENRGGQTRVVAIADSDKIEVESAAPNAKIEAADVQIKADKNRVSIIVTAAKRIDVSIRVPIRTLIQITGGTGEIAVAGNLENAQISSDTGTIYADVPLDSVRYNFLWTESRPRFLSDIELNEIKERAAGKFTVSGDTADNLKDKGQRTKDKEQITLNFSTKRGVILLNVPPSEVPPNLRVRALTNAEKAIVRGGDSILSEAIRRANPRVFRNYQETLPPRRTTPQFVLREPARDANANRDTLRRVNVSIIDQNSRNVADLTKADFSIVENGETREIVDVEPTNAPFNLVLLLDVSGSVSERVDFIRNTARNFVNAVSPQDRLAIVSFADDAQVLSDFSTDKNALSKSLDTFDAGGGTAVYDALGFTLVDVLRTLKNERAAIVILSDGDDNQSILPFTPLLGAIEESGALVYPLYVPSGLNPASNVNEASITVDPLRTRFLSVTTKAEADAKQLAEVSGGTYFPIRRAADLQTAYENVISQLRSAYSITFRSKSGARPRLKVSVKRPNVFVRTGASVKVEETEKGKSEKENELNPNSFSPFHFASFSPLNNVPEITGKIGQVVYQPLLNKTLREIELSDLNVNRAPTTFVVKDKNSKIAVSRWVSPKRTRSYPYERVYNTLAHTKRAAVIPVVKDEGANGDRDFLAWDTISLMSLLDVYVVPAFYADAEKSKRADGKITNQQFDNDFVINKLREIQSFKGTAREWNLRQLSEIGKTIESAKNALLKISEKTKVQMHDVGELTIFERKITQNLNAFQQLSRVKSQNAQRREFLTLQPKEALSSDTKARVTISDNAGGVYFFTCDETKFDGDTLYLIEDKHSARNKLSSENDIKDGLLKMMLYRNLREVRASGKSYNLRAVLRLTSSQLQGQISSNDAPEKLTEFCKNNSCDAAQLDLLQQLLAEARRNTFEIRFEHGETAGK